MRRLSLIKIGYGNFPAPASLSRKFHTSAAVRPLVSTEWLLENLSSCKVIDSSWYMDKSRRPAIEHDTCRIPGARFFDVDGIADKSTGLPHMMPDLETFSKAMDRMLLRPDDTIVVYDGDGIFSAPRVWFTLKAFGARNVRVLDGGLAKWLSEGGPVESGQAGLTSKSIQFDKTSYIPWQFNSSMVWSSEQVRRGMQQVVDARSSGRFYGTEPEPRVGMKAGHMPGSKSVPFKSLLVPASANGRSFNIMKSPAEVREEFERAGVSLAAAGEPIVTSCGSGMTACVLALGLELIGLDVTSGRVALYDGSWTEWGDETKDFPVIKST